MPRRFRFGPDAVALATAVALTSPTAAAEQSDVAAAPGSSPSGSAQAKNAVGIDAGLLFPVGELRSDTGTVAGGLLRYERYALIPTLVGPKESLTFRVGYLAGFTKTRRETFPPPVGDVFVNTSVNDIPIWIGARDYFGGDDRSGVMLGADFGLNLLRTTAEINGKSASVTSTKVGMNILIGYKTHGFDVHAAAHLWNFWNFETHNLVVLGIGAGYDFAMF